MTERKERVMLKRNGGECKKRARDHRGWERVGEDRRWERIEGGRGQRMGMDRVREDRVREDSG